MSLRCGQSVNQHNNAVDAHATNGLTSLANLYVASGGKLGWIDTYFTRGSATRIDMSGDLQMWARSIMFNDVTIARLAANTLGLGVGGSLLLGVAALAVDTVYLNSSTTYVLIVVQFEAHGDAALSLTIKCENANPPTVVVVNGLLSTVDALDYEKGTVSYLVPPGFRFLIEDTGAAFLSGVAYGGAIT